MTKSTIQVERQGDERPYRFEVEVKEGSSSSKHHVTLSESTYRELTGRKISPEECVQRSFEFLLAREPKESILSRFDITVIERYFPEFRTEFAKLL